MKLLKLLSKKNLYILLILLIICQKSFSIEVVDIWNLDNSSTKKNQNIEENNNIGDQDVIDKSIFDILIKDPNLIVDESDELFSKKLNIIGLYDPEDNNLSIDMWINSDGKKIIDLLNKIQKMNLSNDAKKILNISLLTNSYFPKKNISTEQFLKVKSDWLIKYADLSLILKYLIKNENLENKSNLIKFYLDQLLSKSDLASSCKIFDEIKLNNVENYIFKFYIYCLVNDEKSEEAQLQLDLLKETGFNDQIFEERIYHLLGFENEINNEVIEKNLLDFHLSHRTNEEFKFEPKISTNKLIWKYLSSANLLESIDTIDLEDKEKIFSIEKATHDQNYSEIDLFSLYKRFIFNIDQLLTVEESYKLLPDSESRALLYQGILLNKNIPDRIKLTKLLKESFVKDEIPNSFNRELLKILKSINSEEVPSNYQEFYIYNLENQSIKNRKIKFNNKLVHQSKLLNYFKEEYDKNNIGKDFESIFKKIKKNKDYVFTTKDMMLVESLKFDGFTIPKKYKNFYKFEESNLPYDIQILINRKETGLALLRLVEIIGEDEINDIGSETLYFIINALNQLDIDQLRNEILLKILPLKV